MLFMPLIEIPDQLADRVQAAFYPEKPLNERQFAVRSYMADRITDMVLQHIPLVSRDSMKWDNRRGDAAGDGKVLAS
ncbi:hypothetical protein [Azospirillum sp. Sh1]|uniref:hypothetical protein n=1 Tax=Azospirillum sp. Sh1 TaxID=2607285 RepID=UPI0011EC8A1B|nr:hypothetical protein [Azospirillum sp. Sh1]KAA0573471.1 hypothetical protein FZ029_21070 [Azospirillum sp. Sh1]